MEVLSGAAAVVLVGWLMLVILRHWRQVMIGRLVVGGIDEGSATERGGNSYEGVLYGDQPSYDSHHGDDGGSSGDDSGGDSGGGGGDGGGD